MNFIVFPWYLFMTLCSVWMYVELLFLRGAAVRAHRLLWIQMSKFTQTLKKVSISLSEANKVRFPQNLFSLSIQMIPAVKMNNIYIIYILFFNPPSFHLRTWNIWCWHKAIQILNSLYKVQRAIFRRLSSPHKSFCSTPPEYMSIFTPCLREYMTYVHWPLLH